MADEKFLYVYTGPGGKDPQTPEEAEAGRLAEGLPEYAGTQGISMTDDRYTPTPAEREEWLERRDRQRERLGNDDDREQRHQEPPEEGDHL